MSDLRTAAQQGLEALKMMRGEYGEYACPACDHADAAIYALRAALAEPVQEPVAWADEIIDDLHAQYNTEGIKEIDSGDALIRLDEAIAAVEEAEKRHIAPPQRKPLTEEEIALIAVECAASHQHDDVYFARAIERAHGIGGQDES